MEPEGSLPHSQLPATCLYPEAAQFNPYLHIPLAEDRSSYYAPIYAWVYQVVSYPQVFPLKPCTHLFPPPYTLHAPTYLVLLDLITRTIVGEEYRKLNFSLGSFLHSPVSNKAVLIHYFIHFNNFLIGLLSKTLNIKPVKIKHSFHCIFSVVFKNFLDFPSYTRS
jgi:hypothetical protein